MRSKPWPLILLAIFYFLAPVANVLISAYLMHISPSDYLTGFFQSSSMGSALSYFLLFPIAGIAIFAVKEWSYPVYIAVMGYNFYSNFQSAHEYPEYMSSLALVLIFLVNFLVVSYFLIPAVRAAYFDPKLRWWEALPRYPVVIPVELKVGATSIQGEISDIAEGGIFVYADDVLESSQPVRIRFFINDEEILLESKVVHRREGGRSGYGLQFVDTSEMRSKIKSAIRALRKSGLRPLDTRKTQLEIREGWQWLVRVVRTGRGIVPELPSSHPKSKRSKRSTSD